MPYAELWDSTSLGSRLARCALAPASWLYALGWEAYASVYRLGLKRPAEPHRPVLCVGSRRVGGSGKSPLALYVARVVRSLGRDCVLGCSGYGTSAEHGARLAPEGPLRAAEWGDEPAMFRALEPNIALVVGRDRVEAARLAHASHPDAVVVMDDGFQHLRLREHIAIVLEEAGGNRMCLPAGPYREPKSGLRRADLILPDGFRLAYGETRLEWPDGSAFGGEEAVVPLCAIARPEAFLADLRALGLRLLEPVVMPDHGPLTQGNLFQRAQPDAVIVTTLKDWVKLRDRPDAASRRIVIAQRDARIEPEDEFRSWLAARIEPPV